MELGMVALVAVEVASDNERWVGVPFYLRTGKALAGTRSTVTWGFKGPAHQLFDMSSDAATACHPSVLVSELADPGEAAVAFSAKQPGPQMTLEPARFSCRYADSFAMAYELKAYERLLHEVTPCDPILFNDAAGLEQLWEVAAPLLESPQPRCSTPRKR